MKRISTLLAFLALGTIHVSAQERATTESGRKVILNPNGTWQPESKKESSSNTGVGFKRPETSTEKLTFNRGTISVYFNPNIWKKKSQEEPNRVQLQHKDGDGYALILAERMELPIDALKNLALTNAKNAAPDAHITLDEKRRVNGVDVTVLQIKGTIQGIPFIYYGYYYAGKDGCIQILNYTAQNLFDDYKADFLDFLNGFTVEPK